jgi:glutamine amidotransferase
MKPQVTIIDYGVGNLYSVARAFEICGANIAYAYKPEQITSARHLVLPGVGSFESGMAGLRDRNMITSICDYAATGKPLMGICLGMQMFATVSEEYGEHPGLNIIPGRVKRIPQTTLEGDLQKLPNIGWSSLHRVSETDWEATAMRDVKQGEEVYAVHSFEVHTDNPQHQLAYIELGGRNICAAIRQNSVIGFQFHPEKSGPVGLKILKSFLGF